MAESSELQEIITLLREIIETWHRDVAVREEFTKLTRENAQRTLDESQEFQARYRKESDQRTKEQHEFREQVLKQLAKHTELLSQIITKLPGITDAGV